MPTPTKPGWYWWRLTDDQPWQLAEVPEGDFTPDWDRYILGHWGEAIPDNETLKAMKTVCRAWPFIYVGTSRRCQYCGILSPDLDLANPPHDPDCPWLRAQEEP